ncbi:hypothetical protein A6J76_003335 [Aggregatibacter aphrophilus]|nr:hypothetical protein A6J76_003335 [Aggregatibacter aphrophilus]RDE88747.1 hypothetical protein DPW00_00130 [Aggregatibacter aphrophilus]
MFNTNGFYEALRAMYQRMVETDFLNETYFKK